MSLNYKKVSKLLVNWPLDKSKVGRDLGEHLRDILKKIRNSGEIVTAGDNTFYGNLDSLERLSKSIYCNKYKRTFSSTATGLTAQQCSQVLSSEFLQYLNNSYKSEKDDN